MFVLNGNDTDYSNFNFTTEKLKREDILSLIDNFANYYCELFEEQFPKISSNTFKKSDQYDRMKESDYTSSNFYSSLAQIFSLKPAKKQKNVVSQKRNPPIKVTAVKLFFNGNNNIRKVKSAAEAFSYSVCECLKYAQKKRINLDAFLQDCSYISKAEKTTGYFKSYDTITVNNDQFYIGTRQNFETKVLLLDKLCAHINLPKFTIYWSDGQKLVYKNS